MTLHSQLYENRFCDHEDFESKLGKNLKNTQGKGIMHFLTRSPCMQEYFDQLKYKKFFAVFFEDLFSRKIHSFQFFIAVSSQTKGKLKIFPQMH